MVLTYTATVILNQNITGTNYAVAKSDNYEPTLTSCSPGSNPITDVADVFLNNHDCEYIIGCQDTNQNDVCDDEEDNSNVDIAINKEITTNTGRVTTGDEIGFQLTVVNRGTGDAHNVRVRDRLPSSLDSGFATGVYVS